MSDAIHEFFSNDRPKTSEPVGFSKSENEEKREENCVGAFCVGSCPNCSCRIDSSERAIQEIVIRFSEEGILSVCVFSTKNRKEEKRDDSRSKRL